jgi:dienelactone hydrolase
MTIDTNDPRDTFQPRKEAHIAAVAFLKGEINNSESPINGKVDTTKLAIMGHSLGGGAALAAARELGSEIKAVIPLMPYCCELGQSFDGDYSGLTVPTLIFASSEDTVAPPAGHARALYDSIADNTNKAYVEFAKGTHNLPTNGGSELANQARFTFAWLKLQMDGNTAYAASFSGDLSEELDAKLSVLETNQ